MCICYSKGLNEKISNRQGAIINTQKQGSGNQNSAQSKLQTTDMEIVEQLLRQWPGFPSTYKGL